MTKRKSRRSTASTAAAGAPAWLVTYGDLVTLLLTFFVLLLSMSEIKKDEELFRFMRSMREAFGYFQGDEALTIPDVHMPEELNLTSVLVVPVRPEKFTQTQDEGPRGRNTRVETIRPGQYYQAGGKIRFAELSAELSAEEIERIREYAGELRGYATQIQVRGHCSKRPVEGTPFADHFDLSGQRARAVAKVLIEEGIDPRRVMVVAAGTTQPITTDAYDSSERERNDFVELLQVDQTLDEFHP